MGLNKNDLYAIYGTNGKDMAKRIMQEADVNAHIPGKQARIAIKPNLVVAKPATSGATTHPEIVEGIIEYLREDGFNNIEIIESSWVGANTHSAFESNGLEAVCKRTGIPCYDLKSDDTVQVESHGLNLKICKRAMDADYFINVPVLKAHCQTYFTCALKNLKGIIPDTEKRRYHTLGIHQPVAKLSAAFHQHLVVVDSLCGDLTFEEGGNPVETNRMLLGFDPLLTDSYCAQLIGYAPDEIGYLKLAKQLGVGQYYDPAVNTVHELNKSSSVNTSKASRRVNSLAKYIHQDMACSACYGGLIFALNRLDETNQLQGFKPGSIHIGQGNRGKQADGIGIGACCSGYTHNVNGCPPDGKSILDFLRNIS